VTETAPPAPAQRPLDRFWIGLISHPVLLALAFAAASAAGRTRDLQGPFFVIGAAQAVVVIPVAAAAWALGSRQFFKGFLTAAGILFLLNASCWGVVLLLFRGSR
jgi:hypothetical protein